MKNQNSVQFVTGISYEEHKIKAQKILEEEILPVFRENNKALKKTTAKQSSPKLSGAQKAYLNCNPI